jgi:Mg2+ and Co2+ transporter CorA
MIQGNRLNVITKKVTRWAAIIAVPTLITGFYGMTVPFPPRQAPGCWDAAGGDGLAGELERAALT